MFWKKQVDNVHHRPSIQSVKKGTCLDFTLPPPFEPGTDLGQPFGVGAAHWGLSLMERKATLLDCPGGGGGGWWAPKTATQKRHRSQLASVLGGLPQRNNASKLATLPTRKSKTLPLVSNPQPPAKCHGISDSSVLDSRVVPTTLPTASSPHRASCSSTVPAATSARHTRLNRPGASCGGGGQAAAAAAAHPQQRCSGNLVTHGDCKCDHPNKPTGLLFGLTAERKGGLKIGGHSF